MSVYTPNEFGARVVMKADGSPRVGVIVLNWRQPELSLACLESVTASTHAALRVYFVDNGSDDGSCARVRERFPAAEVIENRANLGFTGGNNAGIRRALADGCDHVVLVNNDAVLAPDCIETLVRLAETTPNVGGVQARIYHADRPAMVQWGPGRWLPERAALVMDEGDRADDGTLDGRPRVADWVNACVLLVPARVFESIGLLNDRFYLTYEDAEFSARMKRAGYDCWFEPRAKAWHRRGASARDPLRSYFLLRNGLLWAELCLPLPDRLRWWRRCLLPELVRSLAVMVRPNPGVFRYRRAKASLAGVSDYFFRRFGDCPRWIRGL